MRDDERFTRGDFLRLAAGSLAVIGGGIFVLPSIRNVRIKPDVDWDKFNVEFPLSGIAEGEQIMVPDLSVPVLIRHRSREEVAAMRSISVERLIDNDARSPIAPSPARDDARTKSQDGRYLVVIAWCTFRNPPQCVVMEDTISAGFICPCCGSRFDSSGRVVSGPAQQNLSIPEYRFDERETVIFLDIRDR